MKSDAVRGHLDAMILAVVEAGPLHGYGVIEALTVRSGGELDLPTGTIYPALRRLETAGYLSSSWSEVNGRRRRTYTLLRSGRMALEAQRSEWQVFTKAVGGVLAPGPISV